MEYTLRILSNTVKVPAPTNKGNPIGTKLPAAEPSGVDLNICMPKIISNPNKKITTEPANANDCVSNPNKLKMVSPKNKKLTMRMPANNVVFAGCNVMPRFFIEIISGTFPKTSIIANNVKLMVMISEILIADMIKKLIKMKKLGV